MTTDAFKKAEEINSQIRQVQSFLKMYEDKTADELTLSSIKHQIDIVLPKSFLHGCEVETKLNGYLEQLHASFELLKDDYVAPKANANS